MRFYWLEDKLGDLLARVPWRWLLWPLAAGLAVSGAGLFRALNILRLGLEHQRAAPHPAAIGLNRPTGPRQVIQAVAVNCERVVGIGEHGRAAAVVPHARPGLYRVHLPGKLGSVGGHKLARRLLPHPPLRKRNTRGAFTASSRTRTSVSATHSTGFSHHATGRYAAGSRVIT